MAGLSLTALSLLPGTAFAAPGAAGGSTIDGTLHPYTYTSPSSFCNTRLTRFDLLFALANVYILRNMCAGQGVQRLLPLGSEEQLSTVARQVLEYNKRIQR